MKKKTEKEIKSEKCIRAIASYFATQWIAKHPQFKGFCINPEDCLEKVHTQKIRLTLFLMALIAFVFACITVYCCIAMVNPLPIKFTANSAFLLFLISGGIGLLSGMLTCMSWISFWDEDNRPGTTAKRLTKEWEPIRSRILECEDLMSQFVYQIDRYPDRNMTAEDLLQALDQTLSEKGREVRTAEAYGKNWIKKKVRPMMSEMYNIGNDLGLKQPKFEKYFQEQES